MVHKESLNSYPTQFMLKTIEVLSEAVGIMWSMHKLLTCLRTNRTKFCSQKSYIFSLVILVCVSGFSIATGWTCGNVQKTLASLRL